MLLNRSSFSDMIFMVITMAVITLVSLPFHEFSHALIANALGDQTAKRVGRLTLNPLRHLDVLGTICLVLAGFGWAKPVPVNPSNFKHPRAGMALTALAGPISNLFLAFVAEFFLIVMKTPSDSLNYLFLFYFIYINVMLAVFNLIPINPLDGSRILALILPRRAEAFLSRYEQYLMIVVFILIFSGLLNTPITFLVNHIMIGFESVINLLPL
ncbi:MAG: site-2 protease family protein [Clostridia bacterium]|nr:site-2 protease family protein [Clostridia bacterium]MDR3643691.1 site-2 protease family protein [Clostridia bacterium]